MRYRDAARLMRKVQRTDSCWKWMGTKSRDGYGQFGFPPQRTRRAHRLMYELLVGPIPAGLTLDHLCRVRDCVNPAHLEPVTRGENVLRGESPVAQAARSTTCKRGLHPKSGARCHPCHLDWEHRNRDRINEQQRRRYSASRAQVA